jgi:hypothetical protein
MSLTYIDEFIWKSGDRIPVEEIFEKNSELINSKFLKSKKTELSFCFRKMKI